jgi:hypothetical protein
LPEFLSDTEIAASLYFDAGLITFLPIPELIGPPSVTEIPQHPANH